MEQKDRDRIFELHGFKMRDKEVCMGVGIWLPDTNHEGIFLIAKYMGTWSHFTIINAESDMEAIINQDFGAFIKIYNEEQLNTILESLL